MRSGRRVSACVSRGACPQLPALYAYRRVRGQGAGRALHRLRRRRSQRQPARARKKGTRATRAAHGLERGLSGISACAKDEGTPARKIRRHQLRLSFHVDKEQIKIRGDGHHSAYQQRPPIFTPQKSFTRGNNNARTNQTVSYRQRHKTDFNLQNSVFSQPALNKTSFFDRVIH